MLCNFRFIIDSDSSQSGQMSNNGSPGLGISASSADTDFGEEEDDDGDLVPENSEYVSCMHQGKIYRNGVSFTANVSGLPISMVDQCMQCTCQVIIGNSLLLAVAFGIIFIPLISGCFVTEWYGIMPNEVLCHNEMQC